MSRVFITAEDPMYDYSPALQHGSKLVAVFPPGQIHLSPQVALYRAISVLRDIKPEDFLLLSGDPVKIAVCAIVAADNLDRVRFLRWNRQTKSYVLVEVDFDEEPPAGALHDHHP